MSLSINKWIWEVNIPWRGFFHQQIHLLVENKDPRVHVRAHMYVRTQARARTGAGRRMSLKIVLFSWKRMENTSFLEVFRAWGVSFSFTKID